MVKLGKGIVGNFVAFCLLTSLSLIHLTNNALGQTAERTIQQQISTYQNLRIQLDDHAQAIGFDGHLGTMYIGYKSEQHLCGVLGELLGRSEFSQHLFEVPVPSIESLETGHQAALLALSLGNWVSAAQYALELDQENRINTWNLDCLGMFDIPINVGIASPNPNAEFEIGAPPHGAYSQGELALIVYGDIDPGIYERFVIAVDANPDISVISLGSAGGSVLDALLMGSEIRSRGLETRIHGNCYSACPLVYFGGQSRNMFRSAYRLGFHQIHVDGVPIPGEDRIYELIGGYLRNMGIENSTVIGWMMSASPYEMHVPEVSEWCDARLATWIQGMGPC